MGCSGCSSGSGGAPSGCGDKGHCTSGSCNKLNTFDWLSNMDITDPTGTDLVEISFKKGSRKDFFENSHLTRAMTGDMVVVDSGNGYDIGRITLSGELVKLQMKKKKVKKDRLFNRVIRIANHRDLEKLTEARSVEKKALVRARVIARTMGLDMKIGDVEYQGDKRKATFYYTADGRVDFRELVRSYAKEFRVKIEMRQIGSRQESSRIGGIGSCGRELCCSTWLTDFKSVSTAAARYQYMAINQTKLSGQCGRLKCCLNYELDTYLDALDGFPKKADFLKGKNSKANLIKVDIFKGLMYYGLQLEGRRGPVIALDKEKVKQIQEMNKRGEYPDDLMVLHYTKPDQEEEIDFADINEVIELPDVKRKKKKRNNRKKKSSGNRGNKPANKEGSNAGNQSRSRNKRRKPGGNRNSGANQNSGNNRNSGGNQNNNSNDKK